MALLAFACVAMAGCAGGPPRKLSESSHQIAQPAPTGLKVRSTLPARCTSGSVTIGSSRVAYAATVVDRTVVRRAPGGTQVVASVGPVDMNGLPSVLGVIGVTVNPDCKPGWYQVETPGAP